MDTGSNRAKIQQLNKELPLGQRSFLLDAIIRFKPDLTAQEKENIFLASEFLTEKKYRWLLHLYYAVRQGEDLKAKMLAKETLEQEVKQLIKG